ncbi:MAG: NAD(P)H-dependent oxidoreductase [Chitinivibrionales bacterium]
MSICLVRGNPRKDGFTQQLTDLFVRGMVNAGAEVDDIDLTRYTINQCKECYHCWLVKPGVCIHNDDMAALADRLQRAETVVFSTPLNAFSVSGYLKVFMDRLLPFTKEGFCQTPRGLIRNTIRYPDIWPKRLAVIVVGAFRSKQNFAGVLDTLRLYADGITLQWAGALVRPESYLLQFELAKPKTIKTIRTAFETAGLELATRHSFTEKTQQNASTPLSADVEFFQKYSNIYWEHAQALGPKALSMEKVMEKVVCDVRVLLSEMVRSVDSQATARIKATIQFDFKDIDSHFRISIDRGKAFLERTESTSCDLRVIVDAAVWAKLFKREINARDALMDKKIVLEGEKMLFMRLERFFPPPAG